MEKKEIKEKKVKVKHFQAAKDIATTFEVFAVLSAIIGFIAFIALGGEDMAMAFAVIPITILTIIGLIALAQLFRLLIQIEINTRKN